MANQKDTQRERQTLLVPAYFEGTRQKVAAGIVTMENNPAYRRLLEEAEEALSAQPLSVTYKKHTPPSGDKRDYWSLSIYFWPNQHTSDGLPYVPKDGMVNPEIEDYDRPNFVRMCGLVDTLCCAFALSGEEKFAAKATELLRVWFIDESTRMNPNMLFAQYIPGENIEVPWKEYPARYVSGSQGRKGVWVSFGGVIEDLNLVPLTDCLRWLRESKSWTQSDDAAIQDWYRAYTEWLLTHQHGLDEAACRNNHGSWYWADILCFLDFTNQRDRARQYAEHIFYERLQLQIEPDGSQPEELVRAISQHYTAFTLCSFANMALSAQKCGYDAWSVTTEDGRSLIGAMDWFAPYLTGEKTWEWKQIKPFNPSIMVGPMSACGLSAETRFRRIAEQITVATDDRVRLLYDLDVHAKK